MLSREDVFRVSRGEWSERRSIGPESTLGSRQHWIVG
jgi:hypothetical protein